MAGAVESLELEVTKSDTNLETRLSRQLTYRKCLAAGVSTQCRIVAGTAHGGELFFTMPEVTVEAARSIAHFATGAAYQHCKL